MTLLLTGWASVLGAAKEGDASDEAERLKNAAQVVTEIMRAPDEAIPSDLLARAECVAVVPGMKKAAFGVGGRYGKGAVSCRTNEGNGPFGPPSMVTLGGGSVGLQLGAQSTDVIFLVMNRNGINHLLKNEFTIGGDASAAAGPKGRQASASTDASFRSEILTYSRSRGLFAGVSLQGTVVKTDDEANRKLYGREIEPKEILIAAKPAAVPAAGKEFVDTLNKHAPRNERVTSSAR